MLLEGMITVPWNYVWNLHLSSCWLPMLDRVEIQMYIVTQILDRVQSQARSRRMMFLSQQQDADDEDGSDGDDADEEDEHDEDAGEDEAEEDEEEKKPSKKKVKSYLGQFQGMYFAQQTCRPTVQVFRSSHENAGPCR